jgi:hypothetical protein
MFPYDYFKTDPGDVAGAYWRSQVIEALFTTGSQEAFQQRLQAAGVTLNLRYYNWGGGYYNDLRHALFTDIDHAYIFIAGIETFMQGLLVWDGYAGSAFRLSNEGLGKHVWYEQWAKDILSNFGTLIGNPTYIHIAAHSAGGPTACILAKLLTGKDPESPRIYVTTFGSPKQGINEGIPITVDRWRFFNDNDPVPLIPPVPTITSGFALTLTPPQIVALTYWNVLDNATQIDSSGNLSISELPTGIPEPDWISAGQWLYTLAVQATSPHNIQNYTTRLLRAAQTYPHFIAGPQPLPPAQTQATIGISRARQIHDGIVQTTFTNDQPPGVAKAIIPDNSVFHTVRNGRAYTVYFGDVPVVIAPYKRRAHAFARMGNAFLRQMQIEGSVDVDAFLATFSDYLDAAGSDPSFVPLMNQVPRAGS